MLDEADLTTICLGIINTNLKMDFFLVLLTAT